MEINLNKSFNIFQITDTHLFKNDDQKMYTVNTNENFYKVIQHIREYTEFTPDYFLLTGDLSQDESKESYIKIVEAMEEFGKKVFWIPGNHDNFEIMQEVFGLCSLFYPLKKINLGNWDFIFLNTKIDKSDNGYLSQNELNFLDRELTQSNHINKNTCIVMHHHPLKVNTPLIDQYILINSNDFWNIVEKYEKVKLIICGHVHGDYTIRRNNITLECAPATCLQWEKQTIDLKINKRMGFKVFQFFEDNYIQSTKLWSFE